MNYKILETISHTELKEISKEMKIDVFKTKKETISNIVKHLKKYERHKKKNIDRFEKIKKLGNNGKDGITYLVIEKKTEKYYAMKTFKKNKSENKILQEYELQKIASSFGISPKVYEVDTIDNYIIMEKMDSHLLQKMRKRNGKLTKTEQKSIIKIFKKLDEAKIFHADVNILNYMYKDNKLYIIDFGMSKKIDDKLIKKLCTDKPNLKIMTLGFILKLKELGSPSESYEYLLRYVSKEDIKKFGI